MTKKRKAWQPPGKPADPEALKRAKAQGLRVLPSPDEETAAPTDGAQQEWPIGKSPVDDSESDAPETDQEQAKSGSDGQNEPQKGPEPPRVPKDPTGDDKPPRIHVLEVRARNVKCIREVFISMSGEVHEIRGDTGQGKTAILETLEAGFRGLDPSMVRNGEAYAEIELRLSSGMVKRLIPADGSTAKLTVTDEHGAEIKRAKAFLEQICGPSAFRPVEWVQLGAGDKRGKTERLRRQRDMLLEVIPMSLTIAEILEHVRGTLGDGHIASLSAEILSRVDDNQHAFVVCNILEAACYECRKEINVTVKHAESALEFAPMPDPLPACGDIGVDACRVQLDEASRDFHVATDKRQRWGALIQRRDALQHSIEEEGTDLPDRDELKASLVDNLARMTTLEERCAILEGQLAEVRESLTATRSERNDLDRLAQRIVALDTRWLDLVELDTAIDAEGGKGGGDFAEERIAVAEEAMNRCKVSLAGVEALAAYKKAATELEWYQGRADVYSDLVKEFRDTIPCELLAKAALPVQGLSISGPTILIDGVPLHQLGTSQQLQIGVALSSVFNPGAGFVLVDGAESLGSKDRAAIAEAVGKTGDQLIMTYVDPEAKPADGVTVMRHGEVVESDDQDK